MKIFSTPIFSTSYVLRTVGDCAAKTRKRGSQGSDGAWRQGDTASTTANVPAL
jgi:hypothetical protein